jgi:hypothetical protein
MSKCETLLVETFAGMVWTNEAVGDYSEPARCLLAVDDGRR